MRLLLIANPAARGVEAVRRGAVEAILSGRFQVETLWSTSTAHAEEVARAAAADGFAVVAAMGGDGLVSHVMSGVVGSGACLAIIPAGTTNASARSLGIPAAAEVAARALALAPARRPIPIATVTASGSRGGFTVHGLSQIGIGFDAEVVERAENNQPRKQMLGELHLAATACALASSWPKARNRTLHVEAEAGSCLASTVSVQVRWPYTYFGPRNVAFSRQPGTGMEVLVVDDVSTLAFLRTVVRSMTVHHFARCPGIQVWTACQRLVVRAAPAMPLQVDGEPLGAVDRLSVVRSVGDLLLANPATLDGPSAGVAPMRSPPAP